MQVSNTKMQGAKGPAQTQKDPIQATKSSDYALYKIDTFDFEDLKDSSALLDSRSSKISLRLTKRNAKKSITSIIGLSAKDMNIEKKCKALQKKLSCGGNIKETSEFGLIIELKGDQRAAVVKFLVDQNACSVDDIVI